MLDIREKEKLAYIGDLRKKETSLEVVKGLSEELDFHFVLDMGCGTMPYKDAFKKMGYEYFGIDGNLDAKPDKVVDLRKPIDVGKFDLVFSIEVAEHIEPQYADILADNLANSSKKWIVMTTCPPDRHNVKSEYVKLAHVNEQPKSYWIKKLEERGFKNCPDIADDLMWTYTANTKIERWFRKDLMVFKCVDL